MNIMKMMLYIFWSVTTVNLINGHELDKKKFTDLLRAKRHGYNWAWGHHDFPTYDHHHPGTWGNNDYPSDYQHHPVEWGNNDYIQNNPDSWRNNEFTINIQDIPNSFRNSDLTRYTDYTGAWGSIDITTDDKTFSDRQLFPEDSPSSQPQVNPTNSVVLQKSKLATSSRRISELKCDEYLQNRTAREDYYNKFGKYLYVVGGRFTTPGEFPHMGAIGWKAIKGTWIFICGSSLISTKFMLTAAHCSKVSSRYPNVANRNPEIVRLGDKSIIDRMSDGGTPYDVKIQRFIINPQYAPPKKYFDIAIIELQDNVYIDKYVQPACLWTNYDTSSLGSKATITGWGIVETATLKTTPELQAADIDLLSSDVCDDLLRPLCNRLWCGMIESQLCAGQLSGGIDACQGDSGGPLQVKIDSPSIQREGSMHYLIGITSFGNGCARANTPAVYTRISSFIDWIEDVVWGSTT